MPLLADQFSGSVGPTPDPIEEIPVFLCYRQTDGRKTAEWLFSTLDRATLPHPRVQGQSAVLEVYFDQTSPAVADWRKVHGPALERARAFIFVCSPGAYARQRDVDWVHSELKWWIRHRRVPPILIDTTGEGERWIPEEIQSRWPNAQRIVIRTENLDGPGESEHRGRTRSRILEGIRYSEVQVTDEELVEKKRLIRGLVAALVLLAVSLGAVLWQRNTLKQRQREIQQQQQENLRYADAQRLGLYKAEAESVLWPAIPSLIPRMKEWLEKARALAGRVEAHRRELVDFRRMRGGIARDEESRPIWTFSDPEAQRQHDVLSKLVSDLNWLSGNQPDIGTLREMERRLLFAETVQHRTLDDHTAEWSQAIAEIAAEPVYNGLRIKPQLGLVPVGRDPKSGLQEFGHLQTGEIPRRLGDGRLILSADTGLVFVLIPGGSFWMGAQKSDPKQPNYDPLARDDESDDSGLDRITLAPFFLSKYEMTQGQWLRIKNENPSLYAAGSNREEGTFTLRHPVEQVSWDDATMLLAKLGLRLPTEAQWEYAARAGTNTVTSMGKSLDKLQGAANLADKAAARAGKTWVKDQPDGDDGFVFHAPVGSFLPNPWGLHDMYGNVWEWCREIKGSYELPVQGPEGERKPGRDVLRVRRGSAFTYKRIESRSAYRAMAAPQYRTLTTGVRPTQPILP